MNALMRESADRYKSRLFNAAGGAYETVLTKYSRSNE